MERKKKKLIYNVVVSLLLIAGLVWVCSHFVHLGNVAYTDNAQVKQLIYIGDIRVRHYPDGLSLPANRHRIQQYYSE